jgi:diaminopimelate decarboxylase
METPLQNSPARHWLPPYFAYREGQLWLEEVRLAELATTYGTPCYVYSARAIREAFERYRAAFAGTGLEATICYAVKANSNLAILRLLGQLGAGADVVSAGELYRARQAGIDPAKIVFAGAGKTAAEIDFALDQGIAAFNIESAGELALLERRAQARLTSPHTVAVSLRINPDVEAGTHPYITTGKHSNKFGLAPDEAKRLALAISQSSSLRLRGLQMHIGSQLLQVEPIVTAFGRLLALASEVEALTGHKLEYLDLGGGLGASYNGEQPEPPDVLARAIAGLMAEQGRSYPLLAEPGRYIVAEAGALLTEVLYLKTNQEVNFAIVDAGMNDLIRPALYQATHKIVPLAAPASHEASLDYEVVGPVCESGDWLGHQVPLANPAAGARLAILSAGAYGFTMASNYNSRPRPAEILVDGSNQRLIRRRETLQDLIALEES